jgi:hypothetical protein
MSDQDDLPPEYADIPRDQLKHGKGRFAGVILVPQPSDDPNDPLNVRPLLLQATPILIHNSGPNGKKNSSS